MKRLSILLVGLGVLLPAAHAFRSALSGPFKTPVECYQSDRAGRSPIVMCVSGDLRAESREGYGRALVSTGGDRKVALLEPNHGKVLFCKQVATVSFIKQGTQFYFKDDVMIEVKTREVIASVEHGDIFVGRVALEYTKLEGERNIEQLVQQIQNSGACP